MVNRDKTLDRETKDEHILTVSASDGGNLQDTMEVSCRVCFLPF